MADLLLRDVVIASGGALSLAAMPPRDSDLTMLRRSTATATAVQPGDVFWALLGRHVNGMHDVEEAFARGAAGAVIAGRTVEPWPGKFAIAVDNVRKALWQSATCARSRLEGAVIAIAGQIDPTTTACLTHQVLSARLSGSLAAGVAGASSFLPGDIAALGLLNAHPSHDYVVLEVTSRDAEESLATAHQVCPHVAVIMESGNAAELLSALPDDGWAVLNGDDAALRREAQAVLHERTSVMWVGRNADNNLVSEHVAFDAGVLQFTVDGNKFRLPIAGRHHLHAALAAVAVGRILNISDLSISAALANFSPPDGGCRVLQAGDHVVLDAAAAATPTAMLAALEAARELTSSGRRVVVCGDLLGATDAEEAACRAIGEAMVTRCGADLLVACGSPGRLICDIAVSCGIPSHQVLACDSIEQAIAFLRTRLQPHDLIVVKGAPAEVTRRLVQSIVPERVAS
jgi:UDP-N-acetylmuramoyl-tripeptide--D-alanyl-D-alanine ligase